MSEEEKTSGTDLDIDSGRGEPMVHFRLNRGVHAKLTAKAKDLGLPLYAYIRMLLHQAAKE